MYYRIQKAYRPTIRNNDLSILVPNHKRTRKADQPQDGSSIAGSTKRPALAFISLSVPALAVSHKGIALVESTKGTSVGWIN